MVRKALTAQQTDRRRSERGMSLIEVLVSTVILSFVILAFLGFIDTFSNVSRTQGNIADTTENLRYSVAALVRLTRMAGTGGLPLVYPDNANTLQPLALDIINNSTGSESYGGKSPLANTDVLVIRGVISGELYDIQGAGAINLAGRQITVSDVSPFTTLPQTLVDNDNEEGKPILIALQLPLSIEPTYGGVRPYGNYRLVEAAATDPVTVSGGTMTIDYLDSGVSTVSLNPTGAFSTFSTGFAYAVGFVDVYTFFVSTNAEGEPALYRFRQGATDAEELIPNIADLQVALGCDTNLDGTIDNATEWLNGATGDQLASLREVRLSVVARTQDRSVTDSSDETWEVANPEDGAPHGGDFFRYRVLTVRIALRSHPPMSTT